MQTNRPLPGRRALLQAGTWRAVAGALAWLCLTEGDGGWLLGAPAVALLVAASLFLAPPGAAPGFSAAGFLRFSSVFVYRSFAAGVQVARLAFSPPGALKPGFVVLATRLPPGMPRVLLANTLTLQPGTLSVGLDRDRLEIHVLDTTRPLDADVRNLEGHIARMLGLAS